MNRWSCLAPTWSDQRYLVLDRAVRWEETHPHHFWCVKRGIPHIIFVYRKKNPNLSENTDGQIVCKKLVNALAKLKKSTKTPEFVVEMTELELVSNYQKLGGVSREFGKLDLKNCFQNHWLTNMAEHHVRPIQSGCRWSENWDTRKNKMGLP